MSNQADLVLMQSIRTKWGAAIKTAVAASTVPEAFLAALIANESGGNSTAQRFEPAVFGKILTVTAGKAAAYHPAGVKNPIGAADFMKYICPSGLNTVSYGLARAVELATSWGLTQIMGWHFIESGKITMLPSIAVNAPGQLACTLSHLVIFANEYNLDLGKDFADLFHCWNTGEPDFPDATPTTDPNYVANGAARMALYAQLADAALPSAKDLDAVAAEKPQGGPEDSQTIGHGTLP